MQVQGFYGPYPYPYYLKGKEKGLPLYPLPPAYPLLFEGRACLCMHREGIILFAGACRCRVEVVCRRTGMDLNGP
jgi:hypothetical protein